MTRHDEYKEGCWAVWPKCCDHQDIGYCCWDTVAEAQEWSDANPKAALYDHYRLVRLHRVTIGDIATESRVCVTDRECRELAKTMAKLDVALTERWVAAEEREIEPAAKDVEGVEDCACGASPIRRVLAQPAGKSVLLHCPECARSGPWSEDGLEARCNWNTDMCAIKSQPPADPLLSRLLAAWGKVTTRTHDVVVSHIEALAAIEFKE